jgi:hypothetical protein
MKMIGSSLILGLAISGTAAATTADDYLISEGFKSERLHSDIVVENDGQTRPLTKDERYLVKERFISNPAIDRSGSEQETAAEAFVPTVDPLPEHPRLDG